MRNTPSGFLPRLHRGFGSRRGVRMVVWAPALRAIRYRLKQATDRGIGARMTDLRFNPFLYLIESRG